MINPRTVFCLMLVGCQVVLATFANSAIHLSPTALAATKDGKLLYVACATANQVLCFDTVKREISAFIPMPQSPSGLVLSADEARLFVTCAAPEGKICIVDANKLKILETFPAHHTPMAPVLSRDGKTLYVCNRFDNDVSVIDLVSKKELRRIGVRREPVAADITRDGKFLLVANHLSNGRADKAYVAATVSVIDLETCKVIKEIQLPNGSESLNGIRVSPDGKYVAVSHIVSNYKSATTQVTSGWINANAVTIIDLTRMEVYTVLLDEPRNGAANPWGVGWSEDGAKLVVAHAGTHEVSVINFPTLAASLFGRSEKRPGAMVKGRILAPLSTDGGPELPFLVGARERVKLAATDLGPRALVIVGQTAYVANYFSDTLSVIDLSAPKPKAESVSLGPHREMDVVRRGEFYFHDASICMQGWQSCASCHPDDARADGLNWDLLNDEIANPKNTKSLLLAHKTPPAMSLGVRANAESAVRAGIEHILFSKQPEEVATAIDEYLKSLKPVPSPYLAHGKLSASAKRGKKVFTCAGCAVCHPPGLFTDLHQYDVGTRSVWDKPTDKFDTPTLVELWRTAPYLHDGSAVTVREVVTTRNALDEHGKTSNLSSREIDDLCEYLLSL